MSLSDRVLLLRKERGWSQAELASRIGADPGQISRYENGRIAPNADGIVRLAEAFDVSCDYLLVETAPRRPLHTPTDHLGDRLNDLATLDPDDQAALLRMLDALVAKTRLKALAGGIN